MADAERATPPSLRHDADPPGRADLDVTGTEWVRVDPGDLAEGRVTTVTHGERAICIARTAEGWGALDNHCPHQGGPLGDGQIDPATGYLLCPWHGYEYDPRTGEPPPGFSDAPVAYATDEREDGLYVAVPVAVERTSISDQVVDVMTAWGVDRVFGMVGHSNLGLADAFRKAEDDGRLRFIGIRHEGAAAFAASAYGKVTGRPAACFGIAGPGATNLLTGLWDAKVDRAPILALTGQVQLQVLGPGAFQEVPLADAFAAVAEWSQTVLVRDNASELMALAVKHAVVERDVAHLIFPDDVQDLPGLADPPERPREGRIAAPAIAPPADDLARAVELLEQADRPLIVTGNGARPFRDDVVALAEHIDAPIITTFKAKGLVADRHPLAASVVGRSGTPIAAALMARADAMLVLGASFSNHSGLATWVPTIQVDFDRMTLGKFHPVDVPLWGEIGTTVAALRATLPAADRPDLRDDLARQWRLWREEKQVREGLVDEAGRCHPARVFAALTEVMPTDAAITVDVGNNAYAFGHYFECSGHQDVVMSGYLGSIGFALPAALGVWAAVGGQRKVVSISGDGGLGQYLAEFTTAVKYGMDITHVVCNNAELGKISREQISAVRPVWQTDLVNPDFAAFADLCGGRGFRCDDPDRLADVLAEAIAVDGPALVEIPVQSQAV